MSELEQDARAQSRPFRDELAELSDKGDAKQSLLNLEESPSFKEGVLQTKVREYKAIVQQIDDLEERKKVLSQEVLQLLPQETKAVTVAEYRVWRRNRLSIKTSIKEARAFDAVKMEEVVDKKKIKDLIEQGMFVPGVSELQWIQVGLLPQDHTTQVTEN